MRILLVEDDLGLADSVIAALRDRGHSVDHEWEVVEAIHAVQTDPPYDVLLCDWEIVGGQGWEVIEICNEWCRDFPEADRTTTILWSGLGRLRDMQRIGVTADHIMTKDRTPEVLDLIEGLG